MKKLLLLCALIFSTVSFSKSPAVHGMLLFGKKHNYISHLPMFHEPHDYQLISEVELKDFEPGTLSKYEKAKLQSGIFTLVPKPMEMSDLLTGTIKSFTATIYKGHFERGGTKMGDVIVSMKMILLGAKLNKDDKSSSDFLSFGQDGEYFLAHVIKGKPSYDAIYETAQPYKLIVPACGRAACPEPFTVPLADSLLPGTLKSLEEHGKVHPSNMALGQRNLMVDVAEPFYVEYGDLTH